MGPPEREKALHLQGVLPMPEEGLKPPTRGLILRRRSGGVRPGRPAAPLIY